MRNLDYIDAEDRAPQSFRQFRRITPLATMKAYKQARPAFSTDLRHLKTYKSWSSNARFTPPDYTAGWYIFDKAGGSKCNGLAAVGSTKTGSMLAFENFYGPMGAGKVIGDAHVDWWNALGSSHSLHDRRWYYGLTLLGDPTLNWWTGAIPRLRSPYNEDVFDHFPRRITLQWDHLGLPNTVYNVEVDAFGAHVSGRWSAEVNQTWLVSGALTQNSFEHLFVRAQRGRWRVRAKVGGQTCPWSPWRYFRFTV